MDEAGPLSLYIVASHYLLPQCFSIIQLDTSEFDLENAEPPAATPEQLMEKAKVVENTVEIHLNREPPYHERQAVVGWLLSPPTSSTEDLYMVPNWGFGRGYSQTVTPLHGYKFNFTTGSLLPINPPKRSKKNGFVVNVRGHIYSFGYELKRHKDSVFQCYDPDSNSWNSPEPFPGDDALGPILATAVWGDTILFNLDRQHICAYDVSREKWYEVCVDDEVCYCMEGDAVVLEDTIYALVGFSDLVLSISIEKNQSDDEILLFCSAENWVEPMDFSFSLDMSDEVFRRSKHLVCLGKDTLCLVQSYIMNYHTSLDYDGYQNVFLTCIKVDGKKLRIEKECINKVKLPEPGQFYEQFQVLHCFSMPKCKTTALKEGRRFDLEPFPASMPVKEEKHEVVQMDNALSQLNIIDEEDEGCPVCVKEWGPYDPSAQCMELREFGPVDKLGVEIRINKEERSFAMVEFESATSERRAFAVCCLLPLFSTVINLSLVKSRSIVYLLKIMSRALPIKFENSSKMLDLRPFILPNLTLDSGGHNNEALEVGSSSCGNNKLKNHGEVSGSNTTSCDGHNGGPKEEKLPDKVADLVSYFSGLENDQKMGMMRGGR